MLVVVTLKIKTKDNDTDIVTLHPSATTLYVLREGTWFTEV